MLQKYSLKGAREFAKFARRLDKERRSYEFLATDTANSERELVQSVIEYMPLGIALMLGNSKSGYFLGDCRWGEDNQQSGYGVITK